MKISLIFRYLKKIVFMAIVTLFVGCDFLDIVPDNVATIEYAFNNRENAEKYLYTCYSWRPEIGDIDWDPAMTGGDEVWQRIPTIGAWRTFYGMYVARGEQNVTNPYFNFWDGDGRMANAGNNLWIAIRDCNTFLENINSPLISQTDWEKKRWISEVKFLKAYYHFYLLRAYGPIPIVDKNLPISAGVDEVRVWREPIDDVVEYIVTLLEEAIIGLPNADEVIRGTEAGRADKLAAYTLRAYVRLWAASPLVNRDANVYASMIDARGKALFPTGGEDLNKWQIAAEACEEAIDICHEQGKILYREIDPLVATSHDIFKQEIMYRQAICDRWNSELIWGGTNYNNGVLAQNSTPRVVRLDPERLNNFSAEWSPTLKIVERYYSANGVPIREDKEWVSNSWYNNRYKIRPEASSGDEKYLIKENENTVYLHFNREPRFYASIGFDKGIFYGSGYYSFPGNVKHCDFINLQVSGYQGGSGYSQTGYAAKKMSHFKNTQTTNSTSYEYFPFPIFRLADLYLMYAEAVNEAEGPSGPNSDKLFQYLDDVRDRAGLEPTKQAWSKYSTNPDKPLSKDGLREIIHQERTIELAFEGKRFWDIRRWRKLEELNEQPQGWNIIGETPEDFYKVINVYPRKKIKFTVRDYFFPLKEQTLNVNGNLLQNYGW